MATHWKRPSGLSLKQLLKERHNLNLGKEEMNYIYNLGANKCSVGDFEGACHLFQFLAICEPDEVLYHKAAGGCLQSLERFQEAFFSYQTAYMLDRIKKHHSDTLFYMGFCAIKLGNVQNARDLLAEFLTTDPTPDLEKKAKLLLRGLDAGTEQNSADNPEKTSKTGAGSKESEKAHANTPPKKPDEKKKKK